MITAMVILIIIFLSSLVYQIMNIKKYWKSGDGANSVRVRMALFLLAFTLHFLNVLVKVVPMGILSGVAGVMVLTLYAEDDAKLLWNNIKERWKK